MKRSLLFFITFLSFHSIRGEDSFLDKVVQFRKKFYVHPKISIGPWDDEDNPRKLNDACECGHDQGQFRDANHTHVKPWHMYLLGSYQSTVFCTGTIIASNLLVSSHDCLQKQDKSYSVFDAWFPFSDDPNMFTPGSIVISKLSNELKPTYTIVRIIYNHRYGINVATNSHLTDNLVIFQVTPEFTQDPDLSPICIPELTDPIGDELTGKNAYYYGLLVGNNVPESRYFDFVVQCGAVVTTTTKTTTPKPTTTTTTTTTKPPTKPTSEPVIPTTPESATDGYVTDGPDTDFGPPPSPHAAQLPETIFGVIKPEEDCSHETRNKENQLLCLQRYGRPARPKWGDGIIYVKSDAKDHRNFLLGTAATIPSAADGSHELINFSKVSNLIRYIEYHAARSGTHWCRSEKLVLPKPIKKPRRGDDRISGPFTGRSSWRDDSLDCICGKMHEAVSSKDGKAKFNEFPWVALIHYIPNGNVEKEKLCTGVLINDRVVVTSASRCLTDDETKTQVDPRHIKLYINFWATPLRLHKVSQIIRHPYFASDSGTIKKLAVDIGLLILKEPLTFDKCGDGFRPICFPSSYTANLITDEIKTLAGFNILDPVSQPLNSETILQRLTRPLLPETWCQEAANNFNQHAGSQGEVVRKLCTGKPKSTGGQADKGSPLQVERHGNYLVQHILLGIYDFDSTQIRGFKMPNGTDSPEDYAFYVDVREHIAFVDQHSKEHGAKWCRAEMDVDYVLPPQSK